MSLRRRLTRTQTAATPPSSRNAWLIWSGLNWARKLASKWARSSAALMGGWAAAVTSQLAWAPAGVSGGQAAGLVMAEIVAEQDARADPARAHEITTTTT
jgi:hypothetical protein